MVFFLIWGDKRIQVILWFSLEKRTKQCASMCKQTTRTILSGCPGWTAPTLLGISIGHPLDGTGIHHVLLGPSWTLFYYAWSASTTSPIEMQSTFSLSTTKKTTCLGAPTIPSEGGWLGPPNPPQPSSVGALGHIPCGASRFGHTGQFRIKTTHPNAPGPSYGGVGPKSFGGVWVEPAPIPLGFEGPRAVWAVWSVWASV